MLGTQKFTVVIKNFALVVAAFISLLVSIQVSAVTIEGVRLWRSPDSTRVVFDLDAAAEHTVFKLDNPKRLVIDIKNAKMDARTSDLALSDTPVKKMRYGAQTNGDLRVVLDLKQDIKPRSFSLKKFADKPDRLVVDLFDIRQTTVKNVETIAKQAQVSEKRDIIVAIDAGHGGEDPGAIGPKPRQLYEKDIVLLIAKNLANVINSKPGYKAVLIRDGDYYINLSERSNRARAMRADLFISVHADGFKDPRAKGASVFILSRRGASSQMASILASKANESDLIGGVDRIQLNDKDQQLRQILVDLSMRSSMEASTDVGQRVLDEMGKVAHLHSERVESAGFVVLKSADVPSILVETGFITNPREAKLLSTRAHRTKLANSIFKGIDSYFNYKPPEGTLIAWRKNGGGEVRYTIARGDTLSSIAQRYRVSVSSIKKQNKLTSSTIRAGQTLVIPTI